MLVIASVSAEDTFYIIPEGNLSIHMISTRGYQTWPGASGSQPVNTAAEAGRIWLIWPETLISLTPGGGADASTLLAMFASATADWNGGRWTPENGVLGSDGIWRGFSQGGDAFLELDTKNGEVKRTPWPFPLPTSLQPGNGGDVWTLFPEGVSLIRVPADPLWDSLIRFPASDQPAATGWAVSKEENRVAWIDALDGSLNWADLDTGYHFTSGQKHRLSGTPKIPPWGITWLGHSLVLAYPGLLALISTDKETVSMEQQFTHPQIPKRWYGVRGGGDFLLIHSPESGNLTVLKEKSGKTGQQPVINDDFPQLLRTRTLEAGIRLESSGFPDSAERFYGWILPEVRAMRSRQPMDEFWPDLEAELTQRRAVLREKY